MASGTYALLVSVLALILPREGVDAFVHPRTALRSSRPSDSIMNKATIMSAALERRAFLSQVVGGLGIGVLGLGLATERATAYEVSLAGMLERGCNSSTTRHQDTVEQQSVLVALRGQTLGLQRTR